jgi:archaeosine-15-forming tRNA-guanine transglycosylase
MENTTFKNKAVIDELNTILFYSFDAETKEAITYNDHTFTLNPTERIQEFMN